MSIARNVENYRKELMELPRKKLLEMIYEQDQDLFENVLQIERVFKEELTHLTWPDGSQIQGKDFTKEDLALLIDPPFIPSKELEEAGIDEESQYYLHIANDIVLWAKTYLGIKPRAYQILMLRDPSNRKVFRLGRRAGKTFCLAIKIIHYCYTTNNGRCLIMAPMKTQVGLIYEEALNLMEDTPVKDGVLKARQSPQHEMYFKNGATARFFTTGMRSGSKSDVARGQEAHVIILDEMDYMGPEDLDALYAMLQVTDENQPTKEMIGASTPTGRRERFYDWCINSKYFKEFWFPSYVSPLWDETLEEEMREIYTEMAYRHEIEADWGEDAAGVYPRRYVDRAFAQEWDYVPIKNTQIQSNFIMGVDWDKFGAGPNIVILEVVGHNTMDEFKHMAGRLRVAYREEIPQSDYALSNAVKRVIELDKRFKCEYIYIDRGYGDHQYEVLQQYGLDHPDRDFKKKLKGIHSASSLEVKDPATKQPIKKDIKVFMVENLKKLLEEGGIFFSNADEELYTQLISYTVQRFSASGKPVFGPSGSQVDHAHDALILACLAYSQHYDELLTVKYTTKTKSFSNGLVMPQASRTSRKNIDVDYPDEEDSVLGRRRRRMAKRSSNVRSISRRMF